MRVHDDFKQAIGEENSKTCFLVFSTREKHMPKVIERLSDFLSNEFHFSVIKLDEARVAGTQMLPDIIKYTKECNLGIVILDGLRPNVLLELGMMLASGMPCIILVESRAIINVASFMSDIGQKALRTPHIKIDVAKHISDISNTSWNVYPLQDDTAFRSLIRAEIKKLWSRIEQKGEHAHIGYTKKAMDLIKRIDGSKDFSPKRHELLIASAYKIIKLFPKDHQAHIIFHIARSYIRRNELQTAFKEVAHGLAVSPNYDQLLVMKGRILFDLGHRKDGIGELKTAFLRSPRNKYLRDEYLHLLNRDNKPKEVLKILSNLKYEFLLVDNLIPLKAQALYLNGEIEASLGLLIEMYEYNSNKWAIHKIMTLLSDPLEQNISKELTEKIRWIVERTILKKQVPCYDCFVGGCQSIGLVDLAKNILFEWIKSSKKKGAEECNEFAFKLISLGEYKKAWGILRGAIKRFPNDSYLNATYGLYQFQVVNNFNAGNKYYLKAISIRPNDIPLKRMHFYQIGKYYDRIGDKTLAKKNYVHALQIKTDYLQSAIEISLKVVSRSLE